MSSWDQSVANCCGDCGICCYGTWCGPCLVCQNANSLNSSAFCCSLLSCFFPCIPAWWFRDSARTRYDIEGNCCCDCCVSMLFPCCVQCQVAREVKVQGEKAASVTAALRNKN